MPILMGTPLGEIPSLLAGNIAAYNSNDANRAGYNHHYAKYIAARSIGIKATGSLRAWLVGDGATEIQTLLNAFGMDARNSQLVPGASFRRILSAINPAIINWVADITLPLDAQPHCLVNAATGATLAAEIKLIYTSLAAPGSVTSSGGFVAASKAMHCLFPDLAPMIDGAHTGISYYNIDRATYVPPLGIDSWARWIGMPIQGVANPSPRGAGRNAWQWHQFMAAIGVNQHIYELWQLANNNIGLQAFMALDPTLGTTGIPRIIDKCLW